MKLATVALLLLLPTHNATAESAPDSASDALRPPDVRPPGHPQGLIRYSEKAILQNYALVCCVANGLAKGDPSLAFAAAAAREYLDQGNLPLEAYHEAVELGRKFIAWKYYNVRGENLLYMKCIDLAHSGELNAIFKKYMHKQPKRGG